MHAVPRCRLLLLSQDLGLLRVFNGRPGTV
jgi:hypothetical protein